MRPQNKRRFRNEIKKAMQDHDRLVVIFDYTDKRGVMTRRVVSPIRFAGSGLGADKFLALCLSREEPRMFQLDRISNLQLAGAHHFLMPVPMDAPLDLPYLVAV